VTLVIINSDEVAQRRKELGLSRKELAVRSGIAYSTVSVVERGERKVRVSTASRLAKGLDIERRNLGRAVSK
jgi:transcriptional regulator with XRE-family HTH domain